MSRRLSAVLVAAATVVALVQPATANPLQAGSATAALPVLAGTTVLTFRGPSAIKLQVPRALELRRDNVTLAVSGGRAAFGFLGPRPEDGRNICRAGFEKQVETPDPWCTDISFEAMDGWVLSPNVSMGGVQAFPAGPAEFHMVTDGVVTVTITAPELSGSRSYDATGKIRSSLRETPVACQPAGRCNQGLGQQMFDDVPGSSIVGSPAFSQRPNNIPATGDPSPGSATGASCIYPNEYNPEKSPRIQDHPTGCDADETGPGRWQGRYVTGLNPLGLSIATLQADHVDRDGTDVYTGYVAHQFESTEAIGEPAGQFGGWSYWINRTIDCPSGDFAAC